MRAKFKTEPVSVAPVLGLDLAGLVTLLGAISSIAVIAGAGFIVVQLRQNANLLKASARQEKKQAAFSMLEKLTHESFASRRGNFYQIIRKYKERDWKDFDDSPEDFEVRSFAYSYELYGQLVRDGTIDFPLIANMLQYIVIFDWKMFETTSDHFKKRFGLRVSPWHDFEWLAKETEKYISIKQSAP